MAPPAGRGSPDPDPPAGDLETFGRGCALGRETQDERGAGAPMLVEGLLTPTLLLATWRPSVGCAPWVRRPRTSGLRRWSRVS